MNRSDGFSSHSSQQNDAPEHNQKQRNFLNPKVAGKVKKLKQTNLSGGLGSSHSLGSFSKGSNHSSNKDNGPETTNEEALQMQIELKGKVVEMARQQFGSK